MVHEDLEYEEKDFKKQEKKSIIMAKHIISLVYSGRWVLLGQYHKVLIIHMHQSECVENKKPVLIYLWSLVNICIICLVGHTGDLYFGSSLSTAQAKWVQKTKLF